MVERWRREHQYVGARGGGALVEGAGIHDRLARADRAAQRRHWVAWIKGIADSARARRRHRSEAPVGMQVEPSPAGLRQRPLGRAAPAPAMIEAAVAIAPPRAAPH